MKEKKALYCTSVLFGVLSKESLVTPKNDAVRSLYTQNTF
jgi:hypothetical protein